MSSNPTDDDKAFAAVVETVLSKIDPSVFTLLSEKVSCEDPKDRVIVLAKLHALYIRVLAAELMKDKSQLSTSLEFEAHWMKEAQ